MHRLLRRLLRSQVGLLVLLALMYYPMDGRYYQVVWGVVAFFVLIWLPGYRISYTFFAPFELRRFERFVVSFAISLALMVMLASYLHYFGLIISVGLIYGVSVAVVALSFIMQWVMYRSPMHQCMITRGKA